MPCDYLTILPRCQWGKKDIFHPNPCRPIFSRYFRRLWGNVAENRLTSHLPSRKQAVFRVFLILKTCKVGRAVAARPGGDRRHQPSPGWPWWKCACGLLGRLGFGCCETLGGVPKRKSPGEPGRVVTCCSGRGPLLLQLFGWRIGTAARPIRALSPGCTSNAAGSRWRLSKF